MADKDKHEPAKAAHSTAHKDEPAKTTHKDEPAKTTKDQPAKDETPETPPHLAAHQRGTFANVPHQQAVEEGVKAAESHQFTTEDEVVKDRPVKAPKPHPLIGKLTAMADKVKDMAKKHKEEIMDLRQEFTDLMHEFPADPTNPAHGPIYHAATQVEAGINIIDFDCTARSPH